MHKPYTSSVDFYVLIPCYENLPGLIRSLQSIHYNFSKCGVLVVDDGSTNPITYDDLAPHLSPGTALHIIRLSINQGITKALNAGLNWLQSADVCRYIARLDCGDLCAPERFYKQVAFLDKHSEIDLVGTWCTFKDFETGASYRYRTPTLHEHLKRGMHFKNMFIHPTVMWRMNPLNDSRRYPEEFPHAEDYGFFYEMLNNGRCAVLPETLVVCEVNHKGLSLRFRRSQLVSRMRIVNQFGRSNVYRIAGVMKLIMLMLVPSKMALITKHIIYGE